MGISTLQSPINTASLIIINVKGATRGHIFNPNFSRTEWNGQKDIVFSCFSWKVGFYRHLSTKHLLFHTFVNVQIWASSRDNNMQGHRYNWLQLHLPTLLGWWGVVSDIGSLKNFIDREKEYFGQELLPQDFDETMFQWAPHALQKRDLQEPSPGPNREVLLLEARTSLPVAVLFRWIYPTG